MPKIKTFFVIINALIIVEPFYSRAYLDPGTGSYIFQIILALFVGASFTARVWWRKLKDLGSRLFSKNKVSHNDISKDE